MNIRRSHEVTALSVFGTHTSTTTTGPTRASRTPGRCVRYRRRSLIRTRSPAWTSGDASGLAGSSTSTITLPELQG